MLACNVPLLSDVLTSYFSFNGIFDIFNCHYCISTFIAIVVQSCINKLLNLIFVICRVNKNISIVFSENIGYIICFLTAVDANIIYIYLLTVLSTLTFPKIIHVFMCKVLIYFINLTFSKSTAAFLIARLCSLLI